MINLYIFKRYAIYGDMRNWNKKQHIPGQYPRDINISNDLRTRKRPGILCRRKRKTGTGRGYAELE